MYSEFPHRIVIEKQGPPIPDELGGFISNGTESIEVDAFVDTPKTFERLEAQKLEHTFDRYVYVKNNIGNLIDTKQDRILYQDVSYRIVSDLEDQGGIGEIYRFAIKREDGVNNAN